MRIVFLVVFLTTFINEGLAYGGYKIMNLLHKELFVGYNPVVRPCLHHNQSIDVTISLVLSYVMGLDIKDQVLELIGYLSFTWKDDQLTWDPDKYEGIKRIFVKQNMVWRPDVVVYNSVTEKIYVGDENSMAYITHNGTVVWEPAINLGVTCKVDISNYPFDVNLCNVTVSSWNYPETAVNLTPSAVPMNLEYMMENSQYWINVGDVIIFRIELNSEVYKTLHFQLKLSRRPGYLVMTLLLPLTLLAVLCVVSFMLSPEVAEKTPLAITILLAFTVYLNIVDKELPETSVKITHMVKYVTILLFLSFFCVIGNVCVIALHKRDLKAEIILGKKDQPWDRRGKDTLGREDHQCPKQKVSKEQPMKRFKSLCLDGQSSMAEWQTTAANQNIMSRAEKLNKCFLVWNFLALTLTLISYFVSVLW